jgi:hypothetical protein
MPFPSDGRKRPGEKNPIGVRTISHLALQKAVVSLALHRASDRTGGPRQKVSMIGITNDPIEIPDQENDH